LVLSPAAMSSLERGLMLFYTGDQRDARTLLSKQVASMQSDADKFATMQRMVDLAYEMRDVLAAEDLDGFGQLLHRGWEMKRSLGGISYARIDDCYERARTAGAIGGKLAGAGGGGFLVLYCPPDRQAAVCDALSDLKRVDFQFDRAGARVAFAE